MGYSITITTILKIYHTGYFLKLKKKMSRKGTFYKVRHLRIYEENISKLSTHSEIKALWSCHATALLVI